MIIDIHTHTFPPKIAASALAHLQGNSHSLLYSDGTQEGLSKNMHAAGIDLSVILPVATTPRQVEHINDSSARINLTTAQSGQLSFGCIHPDLEEPEKELERIKEMGLKGIKVHPVYQGVAIDDERYLRIFRACARLGLIVEAHSGIDIGFPGVVLCSPAMSRHVIDEVPGLTLVLAHMGGWKNWDEVPKYLAGTGVYVDSAFSTERFEPVENAPWSEEDYLMLQEEDFMRLTKALGSDHILFGTDSPWSDPVVSLNFIRSLPLSEREKEDILGENARRLLGF